MRYRRATATACWRTWAPVGCVPPANRCTSWRGSNAREIGKSATELAWALFRPVDEVVGLVKSRTGWDEVERLRDAGRPVIFVTPHLGSYDLAGRYLWGKLPGMMAMYRPHKVAVARSPDPRGPRPRLGTATRPTRDRRRSPGVRKVLKHMRAGGCTIMLPDQVPGVGEGEWVEFFGRPAYTMTLVGRLQQASDAAVVFYFAERQARGEGYIVHFPSPLPSRCRSSGARRRSS